MTETIPHCAPWLIAAYAVALLLRPLLHLSSIPRGVGLAVAAIGLLWLPLLVSPDQPLATALVAVSAGTIAIKLYDLHRGASFGSVPSWPAYAIFLVSPFCHVYRRLDSAPIPVRRRSQGRLVRGVILIAAAVTVGAVLENSAFDESSFLLEHAWKVTITFVTVYGVSEVLFGGWSLAGLPGHHMFENFFAARTPADFWRRYNRPVTQYMFENVYRTAGGKRSPVRATLAAFFFSGLLHEYIADIALRSVQGYQMAFFMIQGIAVAATQRVRPRSQISVAAWVAATLLFNIVVSLLFFASAGQMWDFYSDNAPAWMNAR